MRLILMTHSNISFCFRLLFICAGLTLAKPASAQLLSYGFKTGLSMSTYNGPESEFESNEHRLGFHLGIIAKYRITDIFGVTAELLYSQKGMEYNFDGPSFFQVQRPTGALALLEGTRTMKVTVANEYLDFPIMAYLKAGKFEFTGGVNVGFLVGSTGGGQFTFTGTRPQTSLLDFNVDHRYFKDEARGAALGDQVTTMLGGETLTIPLQHGAYYEYNEKDGNRYRGIDMGLNAGVAYYLNAGLFLGLRLNYGLIDATREQMDIRYDRFDNNAPAFQNDKDRTVSYQLSLGFAF
ncbi:MAG: PorT family protein [Saprospiraceae bacterium]|nr:PorT family protein [Saprospiraceae bacterium]